MKTTSLGFFLSFLHTHNCIITCVSLSGMFYCFSYSIYICNASKFTTHNTRMSSPRLKGLCSQMFLRWGGKLPASNPASPMLFSDHLHMPRNLDFISLPPLPSAPVIQINSNEISRGRHLMGGGSGAPHSTVLSSRFQSV